MILGNRALFVFFIGVSAVLVGCGGGGGGGGGGNNPPTAAPTAAPTVSPTTIATATPHATASPVVTFSPTPQPAGTVLNVPARPLTQGDTFAYSGSMVNNFVYNGQTPSPDGTFDPNAGATPDPSGTVAYTVAQAVTNEGTVSFDGAMPYDLRTAETDSGTNQTITITTDTYLLNEAINASTMGLYTYGFTSTDSLGRKLTNTLAGVPGGSTPNGLLDELPELQNASWSNTGAGTLAESESDGFTASRVTAANGTYNETDTYPQSSNYTPAPSPLVDSLVENADYSGTYSFASFEGDATSFTYSAPNASGVITIVANDTTQNQSLTYLVNNWYSGLPLYSENDHQDGELLYPAGCHVPAAFGTTGNAVEQKFTKVDTVLGTLEKFDQLTYVNGGYAVCTVLTDVTQIFYDYSGQGESDFGVDFNGGTSPVEVATLTSTVGLTTTNVTPAFRRSDGTLKLDAASVARAGSARVNFLAAVERHRLERIHRAAKHLRTLRIARLHR